MIKSRNRVKTSGQGPKKKLSIDGTTGFAASHPDVAGGLLPPHHNHRIPSGGTDRSPSPLAGTDASGLSHNPNIAPQHLFDNVSLPSEAFASPSLPQFALSQPSPSGSSINGSHLEPPQSYDALVNQRAHLQTRVSELEVINDLFRGRVTELEQGQEASRRSENAAREEASRLRSDLEAAHSREEELKRRLEELESHNGPPAKRTRRSGASRAETPNSAAQGLRC